MQTVIIKHDDRGNIDVIGTDGQPIDVIIIEDDHMGAENIKVNGITYYAQKMTAESKPELINDAKKTYRDID